MDADTPFRIINYVVNQFQGGNITGQEYMDMINQAQRDFLNFLLGQFVSYQYGKPLSRVQFGMNEIVRQRVTPFIAPPSTLTIDVNGVAAYPNGLQQVDAMYTSAMQRIRYVPQHKLYSYLNSQIDPIATNPIFLIQSTGFQFYPNTTTNGVALGTALISYVDTPPNVVWNSSPDPQGRPQYTPTGSQGPQFYDVDVMELISRSLAMVGINLQAAEVSGYAEKVKREGA
jgi:hypothetical protein